MRLNRIVVPRDATQVERTAADELSTYLKRVTGARFRIKKEKVGKRAKPGVYVGDTAFARSQGIEWSAEHGEAWIVRADRGSLILSGGRRRGSLYAVYRFLEDDVGLRWWTPWDETGHRRSGCPIQRARRGGLGDHPCRRSVPMPSLADLGATAAA